MILDVPRANGDDLADFNDLLDLLFPTGEGTVAVLAAYMDASKQKGRVFAVCGYAFEVAQAKKIGKELARLFAPYGGIGHMTDLHARKKKFKALDGKDDEVDRLMKGVVKTINNRLSFGVGVGVDFVEVNTLLPKHIEGFGHPYPYCCHMAMQALGRHVAKQRPGERIAYFFESGDEHQQEAHRFMSNVDRCPELKEAYLHDSHTFKDKKDVPQLIAADFLAWEYARYWDLTVLQQKIPMRRSLAALLSEGFTTMQFQKKYSVNFFTGPPLWDAMQKVHALFED